MAFCSLAATLPVFNQYQPQQPELVMSHQKEGTSFFSVERPGLDLDRLRAISNGCFSTVVPFARFGHLTSGGSKVDPHVQLCNFKIFFTLSLWGKTVRLTNRGGYTTQALSIEEQIGNITHLHRDNSTQPTAVREAEPTPEELTVGRLTFSADGERPETVPTEAAAEPAEATPTKPKPTEAAAEPRPAEPRPAEPEAYPKPTEPAAAAEPKPETETEPPSVETEPTTNQQEQIHALKQNHQEQIQDQGEGKPPLLEERQTVETTEKRKPSESSSGHERSRRREAETSFSSIETWRREEREQEIDFNRSIRPWRRKLLLVSLVNGEDEVMVIREEPLRRGKPKLHQSGGQSWISWSTSVQYKKPSEETLSRDASLDPNRREPIYS
ncbi:hypothetical protein BRARA_A03310, partial [Brassica rapa]